MHNVENIDFGAVTNLKRISYLVLTTTIRLKERLI